MAILVTATKNTLCNTYTGLMVYGALTTTAPGATSGTEVVGGSYARILSVWPGASGGSSTATAQAFNVPASTTVVGYQGFSASTAGSYVDGCGITSQTFSSSGQYTITPTYVQT